MATNFKVGTVVLNRQLLTATGDALILNGKEVVAGVSGNLTQTGVTLGAKIDSASGWTNTVVSGGLEVRITATGGSAVTHSNGVGVNLSGNLGLTGQALLAALSGASGVLQGQINTLPTSANLALTGSNLYQMLTGESGALVTTIIATGANAITHANGGLSIISGNATASGSALYVLATGLSGATNTLVVNSGASVLTHTNGMGAILSGNATQSGIALMNRDLLVSGWLSTGLAATGTAAVTHANSIGTTLSGLINSLSGVQEGIIVHRTGAELISGIKTFLSELRFNGGLKTPERFFGSANYTLTSGDFMVVATGAVANVTGILPTITDGSYSGVLFTLLNARTTSLPISGVIGPDTNPILAPHDAIEIYGGSGVWHYIRQTGSPIWADQNNNAINLSGRDTAISGGLEARITASGNAAVAHANSIGGVISGNLTNTGVALGATIIASGANAINHANGGLSILSGNLTNTGVALGATIIASGANAITHSNGNATNLSGRLTASGSTLYILATGLSGVMNSQDIASGASAIAHSNGNATNLSGNMTLTGVALGATIIATGANAINHTNSAASILSGNATLTGQALIARDLIISGTLATGDFNTGAAAVAAAIAYANSVGTNLSGRLTATGQALSAVTVSGSSTINTVNLTGLGGVTVLWSGGTVFISGITGGGGGGAGDVTTAQLNSLSGWTDSMFVHRTGDELITGNKTLIGNTEIRGALYTSGCSAVGLFARAEGASTFASGDVAHAEGLATHAKGLAAHAEGFSSIASGLGSHAEGAGIALGQQSHAEGNASTAYAQYSHAEGLVTKAGGQYSHSEGIQSNASGNYSHAEGNLTLSFGENSHAEGHSTIASGDISHAEGHFSVTLGTHAHAEGYGTLASGQGAHSEGYATLALNEYAHSEGNLTEAGGAYSHSEGSITLARRSFSHAEGVATITSGLGAHAEGHFAVASGDYSHAEGLGTITDRDYGHAQGKYNRTNVSGLFQVGRGVDGARADALYISDAESNPSVLSGRWTASTGFRVYNAPVVTGLIAGSSNVTVNNNNDGTFTINAVISGSASGPTTTTGSYIFRTAITSGVTEQFINFPVTMSANPRVLGTVYSNYTNSILPFQISGAVNTGFWALYGNNVSTTGYFLDAMAITSDTGLAATVIVQQVATGIIQLACSDQTTAITAGTSKVTFRMPYAGNLTNVRASVAGAPAGSALVIDINQSGYSVLSTKLTIDAGEKTSVTAATPPVISTGYLPDDTEITIDFDQVGATNAGTGVMVSLYVNSV